MVFEMKEKLVIWGASGHALVVADIIGLCGKYEIAGFLDDVNIDRDGSYFNNYKIFGGRRHLDSFQLEGIRHLIFGFGNCRNRLELAKVAKQKGFSFVEAIHPKAIIASRVDIQPGTVIAAGAVINPGSTIGEHVIINTSATIDHECIIEDGVHIGPGVHLGGHSKIEEGSWIGIGASIIDHIHIGKYSIVGAGSVVLRDIPDGVVVYGVPSRIVREVRDSDF